MTTIAPVSYAICDILATNVRIVRKTCREEKRTIGVPLAVVSVQPTDGETRHREKPS
jgi:hypothetical protein